MDFPPGNVHQEKGRWGGWRAGTETRIMISCPQCGTVAGLDHDIASDGTVTPSVICPIGCGFHDHVRLSMWKQL